MKLQPLVSLAMLACISGPASAHMLYYTDCDDSAEPTLDDSFLKDLDVEAFPGSKTSSRLTKITKTDPNAIKKCDSDSPEAQALKVSNSSAPGSDRAAALAFCKAGGYGDPVGCASNVLTKGLISEAKGCLNDLNNAISANSILPIAHQEGGGGGSPGYWHTDYRYSKDQGWHRHEWTPEAREAAGNIYATSQIDLARKRRENQSTTSSNTTTTGGNLGIGGKVGVGIAEISGEAGVKGETEKGTTTEKGPLSQAEIDKLYNKYFELGKNNPNLVQQPSDIMCVRDEKNCSSSTTKVIPNTSYQSSTGSKKTDDPTPPKKSDGPSDKKTSDNNTQPKSDDTKTQDTTITTTDHGTWAGEPTPTNPDEKWADFSQEAPDSDPMGTCMFQAHKDKVASDSKKNYSDSNDARSDAEKKRDADASLAKGFCDEAYYGKTYCVSWKKNKMLIDSQDGIDSPLIDRSQIVKPGDLHFTQPEPDAGGSERIKLPGR